jgi:hypothetical protein
VRDVDVQKERPVAESVSKDRKLELWLVFATVLVATAGTVITAAFAWRADEKAAESLKVTRAASWDYEGATNCFSYRSQVFDLAEKNVPESEIKAWFVKESGGGLNPYGSSGARTALGDYERECGSVADLLAILDPSRVPSAELMGEMKNP